MKITTGHIMASDVVTHVVSEEWLMEIREALDSLSNDMRWEYNSRDSTADALIAQIDILIGKPDVEREAG